MEKAERLLNPDDFAITKEKVHLFFILQSMGNSKYPAGSLSENYYFGTLVWPGSQFRHPNFVVSKGLLVLKEELAMYLLLLLSKKLMHY